MSFIKKIVRFSTLLKVITLVVLISMLLSYLAPFIHPDTIKIIPFFGLAYPIFTLLTLFLLLLWLFISKKWSLYIFIVLCIGGSLHFRTIAFVVSDLEKPAADSCLHVMSYNVRLFDVYNQSLVERNETRRKIIQYIHQENPDIVCFQEFFHQDKPSNFSTKDTLISALGYRYYHERYSHKIRNRQNFGICMVSKYQMVSRGDVMFENFESTDNYCIYADIVKGKDTIRVYDVHLQSIKLQQEDYELFGEENKQAGGKKSTITLLLDKLRIAYPARAEQAERVVEHIKTSPYPVVICGDFNDTPMSYVYNQFSRILVDSFRETSFGIGRTYVGRVPAGRIDYIFHTGDLIARDFTIQQQAYSDHLAVQCKIYVK